MKQIQLGFMKDESCLTNVLKLFEECQGAREESGDVMKIDFQKAFYKVRHKILVHKLRHKRIGGCMLTQIETGCHRQRVGINKSFQDAGMYIENV